MGYSRAGFEVIGVDIEHQPRYPFTFHQADAVEFLQMLISNSLAWLKLSDISAIHASPPCQRYSMITVVHSSEVIDSHPDLVDVVRKLLHQTGKPFVIENVVGAPLNGSLMLCGSMFNLEVKRHRIFEGHVPMFAPFSCRHDYWAVPVYGHSGAGANRNRERERDRSNSVKDWARAMGIDWMSGNELAEAIPPAYTEFIGGYLLNTVRQASEIGA